MATPSLLAPLSALEEAQRMCSSAIKEVQITGDRLGESLLSMRKPEMLSVTQSQSAATPSLLALGLRMADWVIRCRMPAPRMCLSAIAVDQTSGIKSAK